MVYVEVLFLALLVCDGQSVLSEADDGDGGKDMANHWGSCVCQVNFPQTLDNTILPPPRDCADLYNRGVRNSGVYKVYTGSSYKELYVYCDMETAGGGWLVFQRRQDGSVDFFRDWQSYLEGFGEPRGEFWIGNGDLHRLTSQKSYVLRIDMADFENETRFARYSNFKVLSEDAEFQLVIEGYSGTAGDSMIGSHHGKPFSTKDHGASSHCANSYKGGWWYEDCHSANLNGLYLRGSHESYADGIEWYSWHEHRYSLKSTEMKIRPSDF